MIEFILGMQGCFNIEKSISDDTHQQKKRRKTTSQYMQRKHFR